jgi:hypothetical protein
VGELQETVQRLLRLGATLDGPIRHLPDGKACAALRTRAPSAVVWQCCALSGLTCRCSTASCPPAALALESGAVIKASMYRGVCLQEQRLHLQDRAMLMHP